MEEKQRTNRLFVHAVADPSGVNAPETEEKPHRHGKVVQSSRLPAHPCKEETLDAGERDALQARRDAVCGLFRMEVCAYKTP